MPNVKLEALQVGMIVTTDVRNMDNMLLIPSGCALTERQINVLNAWGIAEIQVETCDGAEEPLDILQQLPPEVLAKMSEELRASFWEPIETNLVQQEVFDLVLRRKARLKLGK
jgi:hypothetical protein